MIYFILTKLAIVAPDALPKTDPSTATVQSVVSFVLALTGVIALLIIVISGFRYTISRGDSNSVKSAKEAIIYACIGLIITMSAYAIVTVVFNGIKS